MSERPHAEARNRAVALVVAAIVFATALAFATSLGAGFVYDDLRLISHNRFLTGPGALSRALTHHFWDTELSPEGETRMFYRPLVSAMFVLIRGAFGASPAPFHAVVIGLHLVAVVLVARLLRRLFDDNLLSVAVGTSLFALHASRSQSVTWIVGVTDVLMAIPTILALTAVLPRNDHERSPTTWRDGIVAALFTVMALGAKESAVVIPVAIAATGWLLWEPGEARRAALIRTVVPSACVAMGYLMLRRIWFPITAVTVGPPLGSHVWFVVETLGRYAGIVAWPWPLVFFRTAPMGASAVTRVAPAWVVVGIATGAVCIWILARRGPNNLVRLGLAWALLFIAPVLNIRWVGLTEIAADRFLYLPMLGISVALAELARSVSDVHRRGVILLCAGLGLAHGTSIALRALDFRDDVTFWRVEDTAHPSVGLIESNRASAELHDGHAGLAFVMMLDAYRLGARVAAEGDLAQELFSALNTGALVTPDDDRASLEGAAHFANDLLDPTISIANGYLLGRAFRLDKRPIGAWIHRAAPRVRSFEAAVQSRLLRHTDAIATADAAVGSCTNNCIDVLMNAALVHARARDWEDALRLTRRAHAMDQSFDGAPALEQLILSAAARSAHEPEMPDVERSIRDAEIDLAFTLPESARARMASVPHTPRSDLLRAHLELLEFHFAAAGAYIEPLRARAPASATHLFVELDELARAQQRKTEGMNP